jgi:hypothetical protein
VGNSVAVNIVNLLGETVYSDNNVVVNGSQTVLTTNLAPGNYVVKSASDEQEFRKNL